MEIIKVSTSDKLILTGLISETNDRENIIIHIHGSAGDFYQNNYYTYMYNQYPQHNIAFLAGENRGTHMTTLFNTSDKSSKTIGHSYEIFEESVIDIQAWVDFAINLGYKNIWIQSHSLGPSKVAYYMDSQKPNNIKGLIFISPADMVGLVHNSEGQKDHDILFPEAQGLVNCGYENQLLSHLLWGWDLLSAKTYLNLFSDNSNTAIFNYKLNNWEVVNNINIPVIAITGTNDGGILGVIDANLAMDILKKQLFNSPKVKTICYQNAEHSFDGFEQRIVEDVISFIKNT